MTMLKFTQHLALSLTVFSAIALSSDNRAVSQPLSLPLLVAQVNLQATEPIVQAVATVGMTVSDMDQAIAFYSQVLPFRVISDVEVYGSEYERLEGVFGARIRVVQMQLGDDVIELRDYLTPEGRSIPPDSRSNDLWFQHMAIVVSDMDQAFEWLRQHHVQFVSTAPQQLPDYLPAAAGISAFYFRDPDGHNLEIIHFPPDKGDPRWQQNSDQLFLGIDHTAIAVSDTAASLRFYQDALGLTVAGESENYGTEQEHLNNVFGAHLQITGLRSPEGIGIEFLDYLTPSTGRPFPTDAQSNDLVNWQTTLVVNDIEPVAEQLQMAGYDWVSSGVVTLPDDTLGFQEGLLVRDPDGHVMRLIER